MCWAEKCTLRRILSRCTYSLNKHRFKHINSSNSLKPGTDTHEYTYFVKAGASNCQKQKTKKDNLSHLLRNGNDCKLIVDLADTNYIFQPEIYSTNEQPEICLWSTKLKKLFLIKSTKIKKQSTSLPLVENILHRSSWKPTLMTV